MIVENLLKIKNIIDSKCKELNRDPSSVTLIAVSKKQPVDLIIEAKNFGIIDFGENKAQELKYKSLSKIDDIIWHFIGHLQTNKVKDVVPIASLIHSVDSIKLASEINKRAEGIDKIQNILIEVNTSFEESKFGLQQFDNIIKLADFCQTSPNLNLTGLMTMAPFTDDRQIIRQSFKSLKNIFIKLNEEGFQLKELSMGMTNDFDIAIEEGSTMIRIGTAIFGNRA